MTEAGLKIKELEYKLEKALDFIRYIKSIQGIIEPGRNEPLIPAFWIQPEADLIFKELTK